MSEQDPSWPTSDDDQSTPPAPQPSQPAPPPQPDAGTPPPPPPPAAQPGVTGISAGLGPRFVARLIDGIITGVVGFLLGVALPGDSLLLSGIVGALISLGYFVWLETSTGATPGKKVVNLKVVGASGGNPTVEESLKRNSWLAFQIVPILGGIASLAAVIAIAVTISSNDDNRGIHDTFAGTSVPKV